MLSDKVRQRMNHRQPLVARCHAAPTRLLQVLKKLLHVLRADMIDVEFIDVFVNLAGDEWDKQSNCVAVASLCIARQITFTHQMLRPVDGIPDPHYHIHVFAMNATFDEVEKEWKALEIGNTVGDRTFYEAHFHHLLAAKLDASGYGIRRTEHHFELSSVSRELVEKFSRRTKLIEQRAREKYTVLEAQARALMKSTNMAFDDAFAHVIAEIGGDWDKWKSDLGARARESKSSAKYKARQELATHWKGEMTLVELASLRPECAKSAPCLNLLDAPTAMELAVKHLFEHVSLKRELHIAGMLLRRGIARVGIAEALAWVKSDPLFLRPDPDGKLLTTREVRDAENKMIHLVAQGQGKHEALGGGKEEWIFQDDGYSGSVLARPGLERLRDLVAEGFIETLLVYAPDRLSRKYAYQVLLLEEFSRCGAETVFLKSAGGDSPEERLLVQFQGMIAEYERAQIAERTRRGKRHRAKTGCINVLSGAPYGYRYVRKGDAEEDCRAMR
jgi:hypothetical protein